MLVLNRKKNERIIFTVTEPTTFELVVVAIHGNSCRLGIVAADNVQCCRPEAVNKAPKPEKAKS